MTNRTRVGSIKPARLRHSRIVILSDDPASSHVLSDMLRSNSIARPRIVDDPARTSSGGLDPATDLVILDLKTLIESSVVLRQLRSKMPPDAYFPILALIADGTAEAKRRLLAAGASDFLAKPVDAVEFLLRVHHLLETRNLYLELERQRSALEETVRQRTRELEQARDEILERLAMTAEYRDDHTARHTQRVGQLSERLALAIGLPGDEARLIGRAALLHDLGKVGLPDSILRKPGPLQPEEAEAMKAHTVIGGGILAGSQSRLLQIAETVARYHHERWDGAGYAGLSGEEIPLAARIVAVADSFDAMVHHRPYRPARSLEETLDEFQAQRGKHFDPSLVDALLDLHRRGDLAGWIDPGEAF